ncbi:hypothetical protein YDYSY3_54900 [Paenibacillus chitinolyticus]|nr:hypothetical protein YDYSY3_54900 [Paenibacillus chitinolyticus]
MELIEGEECQNFFKKFRCKNIRKFANFLGARYVIGLFVIYVCFLCGEEPHVSGLIDTWKPI